MLIVALKVILILILAGVIGWDRERHGRPAGFRTHILVGIGSTIIMIVSIKLYETFPQANSDPGRIAAQVVSGIGFLGAGTILIQGSIVKGLTTAASLWTTAAIGLAVGGGFYFVSIIATFIVFIALFFLSGVEYGKTKIVTRQLLCTMDNKNDIYNTIYHKLKEKECDIIKLETKKSILHDEIKIDCTLDIKTAVMIDLNTWLVSLDEIKELTWIEV